MNNGLNPDELTKVLLVVLVCMIVALIAIALIYIYIKYKTKKQKNLNDEQSKKNTNSDAKKIAKEYSKESIFKFMEFDKVQDNLIVQKNGKRYIMVIECQGVNYDLMSSTEKMSVEEGFLQFLNTLRHPIQIYIQTRTVNLSGSIEAYRKKVDEIEIVLEKKKKDYLTKLQSGEYTKEELQKEFYEVTKQMNLYEYGKDIIENTQRMSLNKNVLNQKYYIIIPYYSEEIGNSAFDKEEIKSIAFSELYTKAQALIRTLAGCEVSARILKSNELIELLYVAYNRDESETYTVEKAIRAGYDELYTTAPDILDKKMKMLDEEIDKKALELANEKIIAARSVKEQKMDQMEMSFEELVKQRAQIILKQNERYIGKDTAKVAKELIEEDEEKKKEKQKEELHQKIAKEIKKQQKAKKITRKEEKQTEGGKEDVGEEKKTRRKKSTSNK